MNIMKTWREPISALTHWIALIIFIPILFILIFIGYNRGGLSYAIPFSIFSLSVVALYTSSSIYHMIRAKDSTIKLLKKIDHMMIFVLIAGTYTPICLIALGGNIGNIMLVLVWSIGIAGIFTKMFWINAPRWLSTAFYVAMGWIAILAFFPIMRAIPLSGILLLVFGGIIYTIGAVVYATKFPNLNFKYFGFHEVFHLFIIGGSICFIIFMFKYIL